MDERKTEEAARAAPGSVRGLAFKLAALALCLVSALAATGLARWLRPNTPANPEDGGAVAETGRLKLPPHLFRGWGKPDLVLVLSGQQHGYLLPCGCSNPQIGGLERRYNFVQILRQLGWPVVAVDLGDVSQRSLFTPQEPGPVMLANEQGLIKYRYSMRALKEIGYAAVGVGEYESFLPMFKALGEYALNESSPRVLVANMIQRDEVFPQHEGLASWTVAKPEGSDLRVGVTEIVGRSVAERIRDPKVHFAVEDAAAKELKNVLRQMEGKADVRVLLYQGEKNTAPKGKQPGDAIACAKAFPQFQVVLCLGEEEPASEPTSVGNSLVVSVGHKGKYVGVVGVYRTGKADKPFDLRYQLVEMGEEFLTPKGQEAEQPILRLMEEYTRELKKDNYLARYGQTKHDLQVAAPPAMPKYVGSEACKKCHESAYDIWKKTPHSWAYQTLVEKAKQPSLRQFDAECIVCHTTGFGYVSGFTDADRTPQLKNVGCESCHGPASEHVKDPLAKNWQALLNPWKAKENETAKEKADREGRIDRFCQRCHDTDNDVTWINKGFERKWPKIAHPTP
jgi:hypothetical protein